MLTDQNGVVEVFQVENQSTGTGYKSLWLIAFVVYVEVALILCKPTLVGIGNAWIGCARDNRWVGFIGNVCNR